MEILCAMIIGTAIIAIFGFLLVLALTGEPATRTTAVTASVAKAGN